MYGFRIRKCLLVIVLCFGHIFVADFVFSQFSFDVTSDAKPVDGKKWCFMFLFFWPTDQQRAQEQVLELLPMVSEVNAISEELNKHKYVQRKVYFSNSGLYQAFIWLLALLRICLNPKGSWLSRSDFQPPFGKQACVLPPNCSSWWGTKTGHERAAEIALTGSLAKLVLGFVCLFVFTFIWRGGTMTN